MLKKNNTKLMVHYSFFLIFILLMSLTPLGFIQVGPIKATLVHLPVILGSLVYGWQFGAVLGFFFGLMSLIQNTMAPGLLSFAFSPFIPVLGTSSGSPLALIIAFIPRILVGIVPDLIYRKSKSLSLSILLASFTNTVLVLSLIGIIFKDAYASAMGVGVSALFKLILSIVFTNGLVEAVLAVIIVSVLYKRIMIIKKG